MAPKKEDVLSPLLFNFALGYASRRVQVNQDSLKLNGSHQFLVCVDAVKITCESVHAVKETEILVVSSKEVRLEVNADKTKYVVMCGDQNTGIGRNIKSDNSSFERVEEFKNLGITLTNQNATQEEIKSRLKSGNTCYHPMQNLLSSILKLKI
jgi:hypothetical protein